MTSKCERHEVHIEGLQATLAKRNAEIARLTEKLAAATDPERASEREREAHQKGYYKGRQEALMAVYAEARAAQTSLEKLRSKAMAIHHGMPPASIEPNGAGERTYHFDSVDVSVPQVIAHHWNWEQGGAQ